LAISLQHR
jgi:hypothetical protein